MYHYVCKPETNQVTRYIQPCFLSSTKDKGWFLDTLLSPPTHRSFKRTYNFLSRGLGGTETMTDCRVKYIVNFRLYKV